MRSGSTTPATLDPTNNSKATSEYLELTVDIWKKVIDVQQHFNDIGLRLRNLAITVLATLLGASGLALQNKLNVTLFGNTTSLAIWLLGAALIAWVAFFFLDRGYHRLLVNAIRHGEAIEAQLKDQLPAIGLSIAIRKGDPYKFLWITVNSSFRINSLYLAITVLLLILIVVISIGR